MKRRGKCHIINIFYRYKKEAAVTVTDEALYGRYLAGDESAAALLMERHREPLLLYINGYVQDLQESEDLMLTAFDLLLKKERPLGGGGSFKAYLYRTARNLASRHAKKQRFPTMTAAEEELAFGIPGDPGADSGLIAGEERAAFLRRFGALKPDYREALYLVCAEGLTYREAGAVMGKTEKQITNLVYRGRKRLKVLTAREE